MKKQKRVLFICKESETDKKVYYGYFRKFSGLFNSARLVNEMLVKNGIESRIVIVRDNNDIDKIVNIYKPDEVFVEALWVVPEKYEILQKLHPKVKWIIRIHSEVPFLAVEGMSMDWIIRCLGYENVYIAPNSKRSFHDLKSILPENIKNKLTYLPNYYPEVQYVREREEEQFVINVACFGAVRPLKNHLNQAIAAIMFAESQNKRLRFFINSNRIECGGDPVLENLRKLFEHSDKHELVECPWTPHKQFIDLMADQIDIGLQVSYTESFNIVAADMVACGIPVVSSSEITWLPMIDYAEASSVKSIYNKLRLVWFCRNLGITKLNRRGLTNFARVSEERWLKYLTRD
jgi:hypothetical protein